jgi:hypothetical protein
VPLYRIGSNANFLLLFEMRVSLIPCVMQASGHRIFLNYWPVKTTAHPVLTGCISIILSEQKTSRAVQTISVKQAAQEMAFRASRSNPGTETEAAKVCMELSGPALCGLFVGMGHWALTLLRFLYYSAARDFRTHCADFTLPYVHTPRHTIVQRWQRRRAECTAG